MANDQWFVVSAIRHSLFATCHSPLGAEDTMIVVKKGCLHLVEGYRSAVAAQKKYPVSPRGTNPLLASWKRWVDGTVPQKKTPGAQGEYRFAHLLRQALSNEYYLLHNLLLGLNWNIDLVLAGPSGLWLWESKYWRGTVVRFPTGRWQQWKMSSTRDIEFAPDEQWLLAARTLSHTVRQRAPVVTIHAPLLLPPRGGIVFTHDQVNLVVEGECLAPWGKCEQWIEHVCSTPAIEGLEEEHLLRVIEALLTCHREILAVKRGGREVSVFSHEQGQPSDWVAREALC